MSAVFSTVFQKTSLFAISLSFVGFLLITCFYIQKRSPPVNLPFLEIYPQNRRRPSPDIKKSG